MGGSTVMRTSRCPARLLWLVDGPESIDTEMDTTYRLARCAADYCESWIGHVASLRAQQGRSEVSAWRMNHHSQHRGAGPLCTLSLAQCSHLLFRLDPPIDGRYLDWLRLATSAVRGHTTRFLNPAEALATLTERWFAPLCELYPTSVMSSERRVLEEFLGNHQHVMAKGLGGCNGSDMRRMDLRDSSFLRDITFDFTRPVILQKVVSGLEYRVWYSNGKAIAAARKCRVSNSLDFEPRRGDFLAEVSWQDVSSDKTSVAGDTLRALGIWFAAADFIGGSLIDMNITSPGLLIEAEQTVQMDLATQVILDLFDGPL
jgi:glutathione synthase